MKILYLTAFFAGLGGLLSGFDTGVISGALLYINDEWNMTDLMQGFLVSAVLIGACIGAVTNGCLADKFGRKKIIFITALIFLFGSILCGVAQTELILIIARFIVGFAIGVITFCAPLYLSEISPEKIRGALVSMFQLAITMGILFSYLSNALIANFFQSWRLMLAVGAIPAVILAVGIYFLKDTPRWYILKGRYDEAKNVLQKLQPELNADSEIEKIKTAIFKEKNGDEQNKTQKFHFEKWMLMPIIAGVGGMFIQQWSGINTIIYYAPTIMQKAGFEGNLTAIYATMGIGLVNFLLTFAAIFLTDKIGRKPLLYIGLVGTGVSISLLSLTFKFANLLGEFTPYVSLLCVIVYIMFFAMSLGPVMILLTSEIFPLKARGVLMSITMMSNFIFNFMISLLFLPLLDTLGEFKTFMIFAVVSFAGIIFVKFIIPETKGKTLEEIEKSWIN